MTSDTLKVVHRLFISSQETFFTHVWRPLIQITISPPTKYKQLMTTKLSKKVTKVQSCERFGLSLNNKATNYLGQLLVEDCDYSTEIIARMEQVRSTFKRMEKVLCGYNIILELRLRMVRHYVFFILLYEAQFWILTEDILPKVLLNLFHFYQYFLR